MGLETGDVIGDFNPDWPLGSDLKNQGDDHLRLIKQILQDVWATGEGYELGTLQDALETFRDAQPRIGWEPLPLLRPDGVSVELLPIPAGALAVRFNGGFRFQTQGNTFAISASQDGGITSIDDYRRILEGADTDSASIRSSTASSSRIVILNAPTQNSNFLLVTGLFSGFLAGSERFGASGTVSGRMDNNQGDFGTFTWSGNAVSQHTGDNIDTIRFTNDSTTPFLANTWIQAEVLFP